MKVTKEQAAELLRKHGSIRAAHAATGLNRKTIARALAQTATAGVKQPAEIKVAAATGGFDLKGRILMARKPTDIYGPRFNALRLETGYLPETLATQWGCSVSTVVERAKGLGAVRYTEQDGEYILVIVNSKTRGGK